MLNISASGDPPDPLRMTLPVDLVVEFFYSQMADLAALLPGSTRLDARKVAYNASDMPTAYRAFRSLVSLGGEVGFVR
jgi:D-aminopeptidase